LKRNELNESEGAYYHEKRTNIVAIRKTNTIASKKVNIVASKRINAIAVKKTNTVTNRGTAALCADNLGYAKHTVVFSLHPQCRARASV